MEIRFAAPADGAALLAIYGQYLDTPVTFEDARPSEAEFRRRIAAYGSTPGNVALSYGMWQHSSTGRVDGIAGNVDLDIAYKDYPTIIKRAGLNGCGEGA